MIDIIAFSTNLKGLLSISYQSKDNSEICLDFRFAPDVKIQHQRSRFHDQVIKA